MLRKEMGDDPFRNGIHEYYGTYNGKTVMTADFVAIMQKHTTTDLAPFFRRWIYAGGHPKITGTWKYDARHKTVFVDVQMTQNENFSVPLEFLVQTGDGTLHKSFIETLTIRPGTQTLRFVCNQKPVKITADPDCWLLFEGAINPK
jgi:aminopeptidase N